MDGTDSIRAVAAVLAGDAEAFAIVIDCYNNRVGIFLPIRNNTKNII